MYICAPCHAVPKKARRESIAFPGIEVTEDCEPPYRCRAANQAPLEEQPVPLAATPSLQPSL